MTVDAPVRIGLIGAGRWAGVHRDALERSGATLAAVLSATDGTRERVERDWNVPATTDPRRFLEHDFDAVIVASPNHLHADHAVLALEAGRHVLVEKPMATTLEDAERILRARDAAGRVVAVGLEMRVFTLFRNVRAIIASGRIGPVVQMKLELWRRPYRAGSGGWKSDPRKLGSSILEEPIHYLDLARHYGAELGEPTLVEAWSTSRAGRSGQHENLDVRLEWPGGERAWVVRSIAAYGHNVDVKITGQAGALHAVWYGSMDLDPAPRVALTVLDETGTHAEEVPHETGHAFDVPLQTRAFLDAVRGTGEPPATAEDGLASVGLCLAVERSLERREVVRLG